MKINVKVRWRPKNYITWAFMSAGLLAAAGIDLWRGHPLGAAADAAGAVVVPAAFWAMLRWAPKPVPVQVAPVVSPPENRSYQEWRRAHRRADPDCRMCLEEDAVIAAKACDEGVCCDPGDDQSV